MPKACGRVLTNARVANSCQTVCPAFYRQESFMFRAIQIIVALLFLAILTAVASWAQEDLSKQSQNPVGNLIRSNGV
jgi:Ca2+/H+ antiporter